MRRILLHTRLLLLIALAMAGMTSCIDDHDSCPQSVEEEEEGIYLRFQITSKSGAGTRDADLDGDQEGSGAENYLNVSGVGATRTLEYLVFDKNQRYVCNLAPEATTVASNDLFTLYDVKAKLTDRYFLDSMNEYLDFYILVLANINSRATNWGVALPSTLMAGVTTLDDIFSDGLPMTGGLRNSSTLLQPVEYATSSRMPMAGLQHFSFHGSMLLTASENMPYDISLATGKNISLLRAIAKIEIVDKIEITEGAKYDEEIDKKNYRISQAFINGYMSQGFLLPSFARWRENQVQYPETQQVELPTVTASTYYNRPPVLNVDNSIGDATGLSDFAFQFAEDKVATSRREDKCPVYSCFLYEYSLASIGTMQPPYFTVTVKKVADSEAGTPEETATYPMRMAKYENGLPTDNLESLLRNHIYRFEIVKIGEDLVVELKEDWTVCPMDPAETNIVFN